MPLSIRPLLIRRLRRSAGIGRALWALDATLGGDVVASPGGNIVASQIANQGMTLPLSAADRAILSQIDNLPDTTLQGDAREFRMENVVSISSTVVYVRGGTVYINEVMPLKVSGSIKLKGPSDSLPTQMTDDWVKSAIQRLRDTGDPAAVQMEYIIAPARSGGKLVKLVAVVNNHEVAVAMLGRLE